MTLEEQYEQLKNTALIINSIKEDAQQRLEEIKKKRTEFIKSGKKEELNKHLIVHRETEEFIRQSSEIIQKILADIRVIRISIQEELKE